MIQLKEQKPHSSQANLTPFQNRNIFNASIVNLLDYLGVGRPLSASMGPSPVCAGYWPLDKFLSYSAP